MTCSPWSLTSARTRPHAGPATSASPTWSVPRCTRTVATGPRPTSRCASSTTPVARPSIVGSEVFDLGDHQQVVEQLLDADLLQRGDLAHDGVAAPRLGDEAVLGQLLEHAVRIGVLAVDLVDRDHDRHLGRLGVLDGLDRLGHHAVVGGDDEHDDVGGVGATGTHRGEGRVARGVEEGQRLAVLDHLVGADVLGDATGLTGDHVGVADAVEQLGLAVIDVTHDGDDRAHGAAGTRSPRPRPRGCRAHAAARPPAPGRGRPC